MDQVRAARHFQLHHCMQCVLCRAFPLDRAALDKQRLVRKNVYNRFKAIHMIDVIQIIETIAIDAL